MRSAKELCALLITRGLKDLNEDEEEVVVDYLEDIGVKVKLSDKPKDLCIVLLEKAMIKDLGKKVPMTAYANSLIKKDIKLQDVKDVKNVKDERKRFEKHLESKANSLPGCLISGDKLLAKTLYDFKVDEELGIVTLPDNSLQYSSVVALSRRLYDEIFLNYERPVLELISAKGLRAYARIATPHSGPDNLVYLSPLVSTILNFKNKDAGFLKLCTSLPEINKINFTFYGTDKDLQENLKSIIEKIPSVINAFSYLSLGLILTTDINGKEIQLRVDGLLDSDERPLFAGLIPFSENDIPFDITADM
jgi:hypothetical protein